jgi:hypothetical protein
VQVLRENTPFWQVFGIFYKIGLLRFIKFPVILFPSENSSNGSSQYIRVSGCFWLAGASQKHSATD